MTISELIDKINFKESLEELKSCISCRFCKCVDKNMKNKMYCGKYTYSSDSDEIEKDGFPLNVKENNVCHGYEKNEFSADDARKLSEENRRQTNIEEFLNEIFLKIEYAARHGEFSCEANLKFRDSSILNDISCHLKKLGYIVNENENNDRKDIITSLAISWE